MALHDASDGLAIGCTEEQPHLSQRGFGVRVAAVGTTVYLLLLFAASPGRIIADTPYENLARPFDAMLRASYQWDATIGTGRVFPRYSPIGWIPFSAFRALGAEPWVTQRLFHVVVLTFATLGCALLARRFGLRSGPAAVAGFAYGAGPAAVAGLTPSLLFLHYALAPWLVLVVVALSEGRRVSRCAAQFALLAFIVGGLNLPALVYAAVPAALVLVWAVGTRAVAPTRAVGFTATTGALWLLLMLPWILQLRAGSDFLQANLDATETVEAIAANSSLAESWRLLGYWLAYFDLGAGPAIGRTLPYFENPLIVIATFVYPAAALVGLAMHRSLRGPWLAMGVIGVLLLSGAYGTPDGTYFASAFAWVVNEVPGAFGMRNYYKAAPALAITMAMGLGALADRMWTASPRRGRALGAVALGITMIAVMSPLRASTLYQAARQADDGLPNHVEEAADWLNNRPSNGRVLIAPVAANANHRWGDVGPEIWQTLVDRPVIDQPFLPAGTPAAANAMRTMHDLTNDPGYEAGALGVLARRYGVEFLLIQNHLVWEQSSLPRPSAMQRLRDDPELELVATFGRRGDDVAAPDDGSLDGDADRRLPPIEIYRILDHTPPVHARIDTPRVLVSGDADGLVTLASHGLLAPGTPTMFTGAMDATAITTELDRGATIALTDSNRRRSRPVEAPPGPTLEGGDDRRAVADLFGRAGSQSVATYPDARSIREISPATLFSPGPENRPSAAFDRDEQTQWLTGVFSDQVGQRLRVDLGETRSVDMVELHRPTSTESRRVSAARIRTSTGEVLDATFGAGDRTDVRLERPDVSWVEIEIRGVSGPGEDGFGFTEVILGDLDLREFIRLPDDLARLAETDADLASALEEAPVIVDMTLGRGNLAERSLRREFRLPAAGSFALRGAVLLSSADIDRLAAAGTGLGIEGDDIVGGGDPIQLLDANAATSVQTGPIAETSLTLTVDDEMVGALAITIDAGPTARAVYEVEVVGWTPRRQILGLDEIGPCEPIEGVTGCARTVTTRPLREPREVGEVTLTLRSFGLTGDVRSITVLDASVPGKTSDRTEDLGCVGDLVHIDGRPIPVRISETLDALRTAGGGLFESCERVDLGPGLHRLEAAPSALVTHATLTSGRRDEPPALLVPIEVDHQTAASTAIALPSSREALIVHSGQSYTGGLRLELEDGTSFEPRSVDGLAAFTVPPSESPRDARIVHTGRTRHRAAIVVSIAAMAGCVLLARRRDAAPGRRLPSPPREGPSRASQALPLVVTPVLGLAIAGVVGAGMGLAIAVAMTMRRSDRTTAVLLGLAAASLGVVAVLSVVGVPNEAGLGYTAERAAAEPFAALAVLLVAAAAVGQIGQVRSPRRSIDSADNDDAAAASQDSAHHRTDIPTDAP